MQQQGKQQKQENGEGDCMDVSSTGSDGDGLETLCAPGFISKHDVGTPRPERSAAGAAEGGAAPGKETSPPGFHPYGGAAPGILTFQLLGDRGNNKVAKHIPKPPQLHHPRPRIGHTISPFNLPTRGSHQQPQHQQKQQRKTSCIRGHVEEQSQQQNITAHPPLAFHSSSGVGSGPGFNRRSTNRCSAEKCWAQCLVRPVMIGGTCATAAAAAAGAAPNELLHRIIERTREIAGDAFLGFTAAEAAASLRQTPFPVLQQAAAEAAARRPQPHTLLPQRSSPPSPTAKKEREVVASAAPAFLEREWLESYISLLCSAGSDCWLWWRLHLAEASGDLGISSTEAAATCVATPEQRVHHAAASVSAERQCSAVAVFGGRKADGGLADNELYLLEVTPLLSLDLPLYILGDLLSLAHSQPAQGASTAAALAAADAEIAAAVARAASGDVGSQIDQSHQDAAAPHAAWRNSSRSSSTSSPPMLRWRVPLCIGSKPPPRLGHSLVYAEPHLILYGGKDERGRLLNDVWLLDIFDWKEVTGPTSAGARAAVGTVSDDVGAVPASGEGAAGKAATARRVALFWVSLDFSSSPLNPPGRFLHSCSVFFTSANSGSCSIVIAGGWTSVVLPRSRLYALHRNAKGSWRHGILPVRVTNSADRRFMHASVCAGSSLLLLGGLQIRPGAPPCAVACPVISHDARSHRSISFPHAPISALVGHQAWQVGGQLFSFGGLEVNEGDSEPLSPVPVSGVVVFDACELLSSAAAEPLLATRYQTQLQLQLRAAPGTVFRPGSHNHAAAGNNQCFGEENIRRSTGSSSMEQGNMEEQEPASNVSYSRVLHQETVHIGNAPKDLPVDAPVAASTREAVTIPQSAGSSTAPYSARGRAPLDACSESKRPCSRPRSFDSSSFSKQGAASEATTGAADPPAPARSLAGAAAAIDIGQTCVATTGQQLQGQGRGGGEGGSEVFHPPTGDRAAPTLAVVTAVTAVSAASTDLCHSPGANACTPRRSRRMAALQALESFKQLPDTLTSASAGAPGAALAAPTPTPAAAVGMRSGAEGI